MFKSDLKNIRLVNENILVKPRTEQKTTGGIILPTNTNDSGITSGFVVKFGPGYPNGISDKLLKDSGIDYMPLDLEIGDLAFFFAENATEIQFKGETYFLISYSNCLLFERFEE